MTEILTTLCFQVFPFFLLYHFARRKLIADFEARVGPKEAGLGGFVQELADLLKLILKVRIEVGFSDVVLLGVWFSVVFSLFGVLPVEPNSFVVRSELGVLLPILITVLLNLIFLMWSITRGNIQIHLGGFRVLAQSVAGVILVLSPVYVLLIRSGDLGWMEIAQAQSRDILSWGIFLSLPFGFLSFIFFVLAGLVLCFQNPFDQAFRSPELSSGLYERSSGVFHVLIRGGRFLLLFFWGLFAVHLFLGSWHLGKFLDPFLKGAEAYICLAKTFVLLMIIHWIQRVLPRLRVDQVTDLLWKILIPCSMVVSILFIFLRGWA